MKKILVPVDFSEDSSLVSRYAIEMARFEQSEICIMHSYYDRVVATESTFPGSIEAESMINEQMLQESLAIAKEKIGHLQDTMQLMIDREGIDGVSISTMLEGGEPSFEIREFCNNLQPDIVVMGTSGRGKKGFLEGSVSKKIMNNAGIPVLAVPSINEFRGFTKLLYLTNFDKNDPRAIRMALNLFNDYNIKMQVLHIVSEARQDEANEKMDQLRVHFLEEEDKQIINFLFRDKNDYRQDVLDFTRKEQIDMICFIPHKRTFLDGFFRSVMTKNDLFETNIPLLSIPVNE